MYTHQNVNTRWLFRMHEISCKELRWFVLVSTAKLQYNPKIMLRKNFFLRPQEEVLLAADCGSLELLSWKPRIIVYQRVYDVPLSLVFFLLQGKVLCFARISKSVARCLLSEAFWRSCRKNDISGYIWHKSFIQTVKCSFFNQIIVYQSFYGAPLTFNYVLLQGKFLCFGKRRQVTCEMFV